MTGSNQSARNAAATMHSTMVFLENVLFVQVFHSNFLTWPKYMIARMRVFRGSFAGATINDDFP
jgi:hypothetical protein